MGGCCARGKGEKAKAEACLDRLVRLGRLQPKAHASVLSHRAHYHASRARSSTKSAGQQPHLEPLVQELRGGVYACGVVPVVGEAHQRGGQRVAVLGVRMTHKERA